jgi:hypothetical protein
MGMGQGQLIILFLHPIERDVLLVSRVLILVREQLALRVDHHRLRLLEGHVPTQANALSADFENVVELVEALMIVHHELIVLRTLVVGHEHIWIWNVPIAILVVVTPNIEQIARQIVYQVHVVAMLGDTSLLHTAHGLGKERLKVRVVVLGLEDIAWRHLLRD